MTMTMTMMMMMKKMMIMIMIMIMIIMMTIIITKKNEKAKSFLLNNLFRIGSSAWCWKGWKVTSRWPKPITRQYDTSCFPPDRLLPSR